MFQGCLSKLYEEIIHNKQYFSEMAKLHFYRLFLNVEPTSLVTYVTGDVKIYLPYKGQEFLQMLKDKKTDTFKS